MEDTLFTTYHSLILGALNKCHMTPSHPEFDDYLQHARIELLLTYRDYDKQSEDKPPFRPFAYQKIYWATLDKLRKEQRRIDKDIIEDTHLDYLSEDTDFSSCLSTTDLYYRLLETLSISEEKFLNDRFFNQYTISQIADKHNVSRKTVYRWRDGVRKKYKEI
ncbi:sigma-70 family RNA polymerase sigma factor [Vagococcus sp. JNUCC 83]